MNFLRRSKKRYDNPYLNLIWPILFLPVAVILYLIWKEKMPWMEDRPLAEGQSDSRSGGVEPAGAGFLQSKAQDLQTARRQEHSPDEKRQKDAGKEERREDDQDDLEIIEGIGPKTARILRAAGIRTFGQLAETRPDHLHEILAGAGLVARLNPPDSWPEQARLAEKADWQGLEQLKNSLVAGRARKT